VAIVTKIIGGVIGTWFTRFEWHESQLVGIAMSARGEVTLIFAATALQLGFFTPQLFAATIIMVILNAVIVPPLLKYTYNYWQNRDDVADIVVD
jgi:Kef-type K+ transport system membrane component KefB